MLAADPEQVFLIADDFAETVAYYGDKGKANPVGVLAICDVEQGMPDETRGITEHSVMRLTVKRSRIPNPQLGDRVKRTLNGVTEEFSFSGEISWSDEHMWSLIFNNFDMQRMGGNHVR